MLHLRPIKGYVHENSGLYYPDELQHETYEHDKTFENSKLL